MMEYKTLSNKIEIKGKEDFDPKHILECGQIFRFFRQDNGDYVVFSKDKKAIIKETELGYEINTLEPDYFVNFFNLDVDYSKIKEEISSYSTFLAQVVKNAHGLRILKGDFFEILVSFIISQNNNIKRIKKIINNLCEKVGENKGDYFAFPTPEQFFKLDKQFFVELGTGYRAEYLANLKNDYSLIFKCFESAMSTDALRQILLKVKGVGQKVADCILLFGCGKNDVFPVDVWMERVYYEQFGNEKLTRKQITNQLTNKFKDLSGYVQQYLFYYKTVLN